MSHPIPQSPLPVPQQPAATTSDLADIDPPFQPVAKITQKCSTTDGELQCQVFFSYGTLYWLPLSPLSDTTRLLAEDVHTPLLRVPTLRGCFTLYAYDIHTFYGVSFLSTGACYES